MSNRSATAFIVLSFIFDGLNSVAQGLGSESARYSIFIRAIIEIYILVFFARDKRFTKQYIIIICFGMFFFISNMVIIINKGNNFQFESFVILNKYLFFIVLSMVFLDREHDKSFKERIKQLLTYYMLFNSLLIIVAFAFDIKLFASYDGNQNRFGYKGLIPAQNETTGVYFFGLAFLFRQYFRFNHGSGVILLICSFAALLIGTKGCWISLILISGYHLVKYRPKLSFGIILPIASVFFIFYGIPFLLYLYNNYLTYFIHFVEKSGQPWYYIALSGRNIKSELAFAKIGEEWTMINYVLGGTNLKLINTETDFIDGYFLLGIGFIFYIIYYARMFLRTYDNDTIFLFFVYMILAATGGHLIYSAIVPLFLLMYSFSSENGVKNLRIK